MRAIVTGGRHGTAGDVAGVGGPVDLLVNAAGVYHVEPLLEMDGESPVDGGVTVT